jgi:CheY-like chemotaxis protein
VPKKLLLADDSVTIQRVIELTFAEEDIQVTAVSDGRQAIARLDRDPPDIVLADVGMPQVDGYGVASYMKSIPRLAKIPVVLLAGALDPIDHVRAQAVGCDGVLSKPFEPQQVIARVRQLLSGGKDAGAGTATTPAGAAPGKPGDVKGGSALDDFTFRQPPSTPAPATGSLDEYFDRLDHDLTAATSPGLNAVPPAASPSKPPAVEPAPPASPPVEHTPPPPSRDVAPPQTGAASTMSIPKDWFPQPAAPPVAAPARGDTPVAPPPAATFAGPPPSSSGGSIADAFAALLAAEQGAPAPPPQFGVTDDTIDAIVARVLERMSAGTVSDIVTRVAERLVREEIEKIKSTQ